ncbi:hypothetical protein JCM11491_003614 [Sporobolomyces phaffii]
MLSRLPPELLRIVIESTVPHDFHSTTYGERQTTLRYRSLVSRTFRDIAQPLLFQIVFARRPFQLERMLHLTDRTGWGDHIRDFVAEMHRASELKAIEDGRLSQVCSSLSSLTLDLNFSDRVRWSTLSVLSNLRHLQISSDSLAYDDPVHFPYLQSLILHFSHVSFLRHVLDPTDLPALRALSLLYCYDYPELEEFRQSRFLDLVPQLESITISRPLYERLTSMLIGTSVNKVLVDTSRHAMPIFNLNLARHLRVTRSRDPPVSQPIESEMQWVSRLAAAIATKFPSEQLETLYLDSTLEDIQSLLPALGDAMRELISACERSKVEIVFERECRSSTLDSTISEEFWRRQREKKRLSQH